MAKRINSNFAAPLAVVSAEPSDNPPVGGTQNSGTENIPSNPDASDGPDSGVTPEPTNDQSNPVNEPFGEFRLVGEDVVYSGPVSDPEALKKAAKDFLSKLQDQVATKKLSPAVRHNCLMSMCKVFGWPSEMLNVAGSMTDADVSLEMEGTIDTLTQQSQIESTRKLTTIDKPEDGPSDADDNDDFRD